MKSKDFLDNIEKKLLGLWNDNLKSNYILIFQRLVFSNTVGAHENI